MSNTVQDYTVNFKVDKALKAIKKLKAASKDLTRDATKNTVAQQKAEAEYLKAVAKLEAVKQKTAKETTKIIDRETKLREQAEKKAAREAAKASRDKANAEKKAQREATAAQKKAAREFEKMEEAKKRYFRSAAFDRLSTQDKMLQKQELNQQEHYQSLMNLQRKYQADSARLARKERERAKREREQSEAAKSKRDARNGKIRSVAGTAAAVGGMGSFAAGQALSTGVNYAAMIDEASGRLGVSTARLQQEIAANQATAGLTADQTISLMQDMNDRMGEAIKEMKFDTKTGQFKGTEAAPLVNELLKAGLATKENYKEILKDVVNLPKLTAQAFKINKTSKQEQTFITEAFSSEFMRLSNSYLNKSEARTRIGEAVVNSRGFLTDEDIQRAINYKQQIAEIGATMQLSNTFTKAFMDGLGEENLGRLKELGDSLAEMVETAGRFLGWVLKMNFAFEDFLKSIDGKGLDILKSWGDWFMSIPDLIVGAFDKMVSGIIAMLNKIPFVDISDPNKPSTPQGTPLPKTQTLDSLPTNNNIPIPSTMFDKYNAPDFNKLYRNHINRNPIINPMGMPASSVVNGGNSAGKEVVTQTPIELKVDGQTISSVVVESSTFRRGVKLVNSETN